MLQLGLVLAALFTNNECPKVHLFRELYSANTQMPIRAGIGIDEVIRCVRGCPVKQTETEASGAHTSSPDSSHCTLELS